jgi:SAM-dependent methyltransferase
MKIDELAGAAARARHAALREPSEWVVRWKHLIPAAGTVLDLACGSGRHARMLAESGHAVLAVDRDPVLLADLSGVPHVTTLCADLEQAPWPCHGRTFAGIVVADYLHRPLLPPLLEALGAPGALIYETFAEGNERYGRPSNPDFLLRPGELLEWVRGRFTVVAYEHLVVSRPREAMVQRICAMRCAD